MIHGHAGIAQHPSDLVENRRRQHDLKALSPPCIEDLCRDPLRVDQRTHHDIRI
jgi:hypothetical protein